MTTLAQFYGYGFGLGIGPWLLLFAVPALLGVWATIRVQSAFARARQIPASSGMSGAEVATEIMRAHGITDVRVEETGGFLSDHYDPRTKVLRLSPDVYEGRHVAAIGVAAHEAGHALQHAENYAPLKLRTVAVPLAVIGGVANNILFILGMFGLFLLGSKLGLLVLIVGVLGLCGLALFQLITLPVEFDASNRAKRILTTANILTPGEETDAMYATLNAAAWTYVAALVSTLGTVLYYVLLIMSASGRRN